MSLPNILTSCRMGLVFLLPPAFYGLGEYAALVCAAIVFVAGVTDWLDGFLARRWKQTSAFGAFFDPVADKVFVVVGLIILSVYFNSYWVTAFTLIITVREIMVSALREWMAQSGARDKVAVSYLGKVKTVWQMFALGGMFVAIWRENLYSLALVLLAVSAVLSLYSMVQYLFYAFVKKGVDTRI